MKQQPIANRRQMLLVTVSLVVVMAFTATPTMAAGLPGDPTTSGAPTGEWLDVFVGFGMLLVIGLGGLWFSQHQLKFR